MNRKEFAKKFAERYNTTQMLAFDMCEAVFETLGHLLDVGEDVYIYGFGTFKHEVRKPKVVRHPKSGELMTIPEKHIISFKRATSSKEQENEEE